MMLFECECVSLSLALLSFDIYQNFLKSLLHLPKLQALPPSVTMILHFKFGSQQFSFYRCLLDSSACNSTGNVLVRSIINLSDMHLSYYFLRSNHSLLQILDSY